MAGFRRLELIDDLSPSVILRETSIFAPKTLPFPACPFASDADDLDLSLGLFRPPPLLAASTFDLFDSATDLLQIEPSPPLSFCRRTVEHRAVAAVERLHLRTLSDRVSALERRFERLAAGGGDRKYTWTAEIKGGEDADRRKYKWTEEIERDRRNYKWLSEIKGRGAQRKKVVEVEEEGGLLKNYKWTAEIDDDGRGETPIQRRYAFKAVALGGGECSESEGKKDKKTDKKDKKEEKKEKKEKKGKKEEKRDTRVVEIEELPNDGAVVLRQAFARRAGAVAKSKGKKKELSPQDAALTIQVTFRAYLIRRSQALRALRELAVAKGKLKEIRALFHHFSYRNRIAHDSEERQRFSERIIVLLLTVDAVEGADLLVRSSKRSMVDELEAMLDVVDPQPPGKSLLMRRRTFDMPGGAIQKEIAAGVAKVVQIIDQEDNSHGAVEPCV